MRCQFANWVHETCMVQYRGVILLVSTWRVSANLVKLMQGFPRNIRNGEVSVSKRIERIQSYQNAWKPGHQLSAFPIRCNAICEEKWTAIHPTGVCSHLYIAIYPKSPNSKAINIGNARSHQSVRNAKLTQISLRKVPTL